MTLALSILIRPSLRVKHVLTAFQISEFIGAAHRSARFFNQSLARTLCSLVFRDKDHGQSAVMLSLLRQVLQNGTSFNVMKWYRVMVCVFRRTRKLLDRIRALWRCGCTMWTREKWPHLSLHRPSFRYARSLKSFFSQFRFTFESIL